jgi:hypothetical protein
MIPGKGLLAAASLERLTPKPIATRCISATTKIQLLNARSVIAPTQVLTNSVPKLSVAFEPRKDQTLISEIVPSDRFLACESVILWQHDDNTLCP